MTGRKKREASLRANLRDWREHDAIWLLDQHGFVERPCDGSHRFFKHPQTNESAVVYCHGGRIYRDTAAAIVRQIDKSVRALAGMSR